ncbi:MAG: hypothetical protein ACXVEE_01955 [Polyangiales bacterium]
MKRALGVLAALTMVMGSVACSSSSDTTGGGAKPDTGTVKTDTGTGGDVSVIPPDETGGDAEAPTDKTTGLTCMTDDDCDKTASGIAHCTNAVYAIGPLNPTPICVQFDSSDVCTPTDSMTIHFCDGNLGLCTKSGTNPATCDGMCIMNADGTWQQKCAGKNGCNTEAFGTDSMTMKVSLIGTCQGGCSVDADCPTGSKCDPVQKFCSKTCAADADCKKGWSTAPANWVCDTTHGACTFTYPKKLGDECVGGTGAAADCLCFKNTTEPKGYCITLCKQGDACGTGFTCDALLPAKDDKGMPLFTLTTQPAELVGYCLKNCTADTDCPANQMCDQSAGVTQKTCRPKSTATDAGM